MYVCRVEVDGWRDDGVLKYLRVALGLSVM